MQVSEVVEKIVSIRGDRCVKFDAIEADIIVLQRAATGKEYTASRLYKRLMSFPIEKTVFVQDCRLRGLRIN